MVTAIDRSLAPPRVLFVDDSRLMRYAGDRFLDGYCDLVLAEDGRDAWDRLHLDPEIGLVFTDLMMPVMDGHELIRRIRACPDRRIRGLPVLVVTSQEEAAARERAIDAGATDFIPKPFSPDDLRHALELGSSWPASSDTDGDSTVPTVRARDLLHEPGQEPSAYLFRLQQALSFHQRQQLDLALMHLQLQSYEHTCERYGQSWADAVMRNLHRSLVHVLRHEDGVHRTAPDRLSIILMGTGREGARVLVRRIRQRIGGSSMRLASMSVRMDLRFVVQFPDVNAEEDPDRLLYEADRMMQWRPAAPPARPVRHLSSVDSSGN
ncbi:response regulator [Wenzhouxiangella sp. AB-CW3]|uniref:GGDEF domain-containing response regulator n=1 Tax=Wenzhouxiangella sp. AB-CW3 TaxID=2771012 RepID=UPI00168AF682|nr:response regulator [Wenzhouxiangella sp. AB-CW3]QOC22869.1 response regulator [Wenzhouxiangella sp. AB-CW3]